MKYPLYKSNRARKSTAGTAALVVAAVALSSGVANAVDLTVAAGSPKVLSAAESATYYNSVAVNDDLTIDGENGAGLTNSTSIAIGASATHPVTVVVTNGAKWVVKTRQTMTFSGKGGTIVASSPNAPSFSGSTTCDLPIGNGIREIALATVGYYTDMVLGSNAESAGGVMDVVRLLPNSTVSFRNVKNVNPNVAARILFEGGIHWLHNEDSSLKTRFTAEDGARIILESVDAHPITIRSANQNYTLFKGAGTLETKGSGDFVLFVSSKSATATLSCDEGGEIVWNHSGRTLLSGPGVFKVGSNDILPSGSQTGPMVFSNTEYLATPTTLDLNGKSVAVNGLLKEGSSSYAKYNVVTNSAGTMATLRLNVSTNAVLSGLLTASIAANAASNIKLQKIGAGTLIIDTALPAGMGFEVLEGNVGYAVSAITPVGAVYVASEFSDIAGTEPNGVYYPNGKTFSSGAAAKPARGFDWSCSGYRLQTWDSANSAWGVATTVPSEGGNVEWTSPAGTSFTSVRITWLWKPVRGMRSASDYTAADYVSDGLAIHWDAIDNVGAGVHDSGAATWKNIGANGSAYDLTIYHGVWSDGNSLSNGICKLAAYGTTFYTYMTGEFAVESYTNAYSGDTLRHVFASKNRGLILESGYVGFEKDKAMSEYGFGATKPRGIHTLAYDHGNSLPYFDGAAGTSATTGTYYGFDGWTGETATSPYNNKFFLGVDTGRLVDGNYPEGSDYKRGFHGKYHAIRLYDRSLPGEELSWNHKVDAARFQGELYTTNVVVVANEYSGALDGPYEVLGSYTIEGSASSVDGKHPNQVRVWELQGDGSWGSSAVVNGESYTYVAGTSPSTVRIEFGRKVGLAIIVR